VEGVRDRTDVEAQLGQQELRLEPLRVEGDRAAQLLERAAAVARDVIAREPLPQRAPDEARPVGAAGMMVDELLRRVEREVELLDAEVVLRERPVGLGTLGLVRGSRELVQLFTTCLAPDESKLVRELEGPREMADSLLRDRERAHRAPLQDEGPTQLDIASRAAVFASSLAKALDRRCVLHLPEQIHRRSRHVTQARVPNGESHPEERANCSLYRMEVARS
jgi:hypothetical protein